MTRRAKTERVWVGTYGKRGGKGLVPIDIGEDLTLAAGLPEPAIADASFGIAGTEELFHFVSEGDRGKIGTWQLVGGAWSKVACVDSGGSQPCYLAIRPDGALLATANYGDGTVAVLGIDPATGVPTGATEALRVSGHGPDATRQDGPHPHCAVFAPDGDRLFHVDLGLDRVFEYRLGDEALGEPRVVFDAPPGSGPRHLVWLPDGERAVLVTELSAQLLLLRWDGEAFVSLDVQSIGVGRAANENLGGHLALAKADRVLVTVRGEDTLVEFAVEGERLVRTGWAATDASPRHFHVNCETVLVANEEGGTVQLYRRRDLSSAGAKPCATATVPGAAFVLAPPPNKKAPALTGA